MIPKNPKPAPPEQKSTPAPPPSPFPHLSELTLSLVRANFPGHDIYALKADFDAWIADKERPKDYQKAFYGFVQQRVNRLPL